MRGQLCALSIQVPRSEIFLTGPSEILKGREIRAIGASRGFVAQAILILSNRCSSKQPFPDESCKEFKLETIFSRYWSVLLEV